MNTELSYLWQQDGWPALHYDPIEVGNVLATARRAQGAVEGKLAALGFDQKLEVRSSVARRLGVGHQDGANAPRSVEGLLDIMGPHADRQRTLGEGAGTG